MNKVLNPKAIAGIILSGAGIYWAFKDFQFVEFTTSILKVNYLYLLLATLLLWGSVWFRALRWRLLFKIDTLPSTGALYRAELIGYFGNNILPLRLGELMRAYLIGRGWNLSKSYVFGTVISERILDLISLIFVSFLLIIFYPIEESLIKTIIWTGGLTFMLMLILWIILRQIKTLKGEHKILITLKKMIDGMLLMNKRSLLHVATLSILIWGIYYVDIYLLQCAFEFNLSFPQVLMVLVLSSFALSIPSAPGMIGTYHAAVKYSIVDLFGFSTQDGNSFAIFMHAYGYILFTLLGAYYFMKNQFHKDAIKTVINNE